MKRLPGAPATVWSLLISYLEDAELYALLGTSKGLAAAVLEYSAHATLIPSGVCEEAGQKHGAAGSRSTNRERGKQLTVVQADAATNGKASKGPGGGQEAMNSSSNVGGDVTGLMKLLRLLISCGHPASITDSSDTTLPQAADAAAAASGASALTPGRFAALASIAAGCTQLHLQLRHTITQLPQLLWPSITQLSLYDIHLDSIAMQHLQLQQLVHLHTLGLVATAAAPVLEMAALAEVVNAGGLRSLCSLQVEGSDRADVWAVMKGLAKLLGPQITSLTTNQVDALECLPALPHLKQLTLQGVPPDGVDASFWPAASLAMGEDYRMEDIACVVVRFGVAEALLSHPSLRRVTMPGYIRLCGDHRQRACQWDLLHVTTPAIRPLLALLPLRSIRRLVVEGGIQDRAYHTDLREATLHNLGKCAAVTWRPTACPRLAAALGLPPAMPLFRWTGQGLAVREVGACVQDLPAGIALLLNTCFKPLQRYRVKALADLPPTVTTLVLQHWRLAEGCSWTADVFSTCLPASITHLVLYGCAVSCDEVLTLLERPHSRALTRLTLVPGLEEDGARGLHGRRQAAKWLRRHRNRVQAAAMQHGIVFTVLGCK